MTVPVRREVGCHLEAVLARPVDRLDLTLKELEEALDALPVIFHPPPEVVEPG